jgi:phospholipid/cholesterol/gamma-HCH transport system substrate-binding protein
MSNRRTETLVGLFVLLGLAAILFLALKAANLASFGQTEGYRVTAAFDNIGGLKPRAPVLSAGVTVGRVVNIKLDSKSYRGIVTLEIDKDVVFPKDSSAKILTAGLLGDQYIGLEPGADDKNIEGGGRITSTQSAIVIENLIGQFMFDKAAGAGSSGEKK